MLQPLKGVVWSILGERPLIFDERNQKLYTFDARSWLVWCSFWGEPSATSRNNAKAAAAAKLMSMDACSREQAFVFVDMCLERWRAGNLIAVSGKPGQVWQGAGDERGTATRIPLPAQRAGFRPYEVSGIRIWIEPVGDLLEIADAVLGHLSCKGGETLEAEIAVRSADGAYEGIDARGESTHLEGADLVLAWLKAAILEARMERDPHLIAFHAAALASQTGAIMLAGSSGSGKSTLAAALNLQGFRLVGEDVVLFDPQNEILTGLPFSFTAKSGSWHVLRAYFDGIGQLPARVRPDGKLVKYLKPKASLSEISIGQLRTIIFPCYAAQSAIQIVPIDKTIVLVDMLKEARNSRHVLTGRGFTVLCHMLQHTEVWRLTYGDLKSGIQAIQKQVRPHPVALSRRTAAKV